MFILLSQFKMLLHWEAKTYYIFEQDVKHLVLFHTYEQEYTCDTVISNGSNLHSGLFALSQVIQQDKACGGDGHKYLCVTGAECDGTSNKCTCTSTAYTASGVKCSKYANLKHYLNEPRQNVSRAIEWSEF